jgi:hypothetical protein
MVRLPALACLCAALLACPGPGSDPDGGGPVGECLQPGTSPANLVQNYSFECGGDAPAQWQPIYGDLTFPSGEGHTGQRAALLTASSTGSGRFAYALDLVADGGTATFCAAAGARGTVPYMRLRVLQDGVPGGNAQAFEFNAPVTAQWERVPPSINLNVPNDNAQRLLLVFEMQSNRSDGMNAKAGDTLVIDDVDAWQSLDGGCREAR